MQLPDFTGWPWWAGPIFLLSIGIVYGIAHLGVLQGRKAPGAVELAGAVIDKRSASELVASVNALTLAVGLNTAAVERARDEIGDAAREVRALTTELVRGK